MFSGTSKNYLELNEFVDFLLSLNTYYFLNDDEF